jgi:hypothetical protein
VRPSPGIPCALFVFEGGNSDNSDAFVPRERVVAPLSVVMPRECGASSTPRPLGQSWPSLSTGLPGQAGATTMEQEEQAIRSSLLTIFWHCGFAAFSFRTRFWARPGNEPSMVLAEDCAVSGSGNADLRRKVRSSGRGGPGRSSSLACRCAAAHPPDRRASAS